MDGQVAVQIGDSRRRLAAGESVLAPRRVPHTFCTGHPARMLFAFAPAGKMEQFFRDGEKNLSKLYSPEFMSQYGMQMTASRHPEFVICSEMAAKRCVVHLGT